MRPFQKQTDSQQGLILRKNDLSRDERQQIVSWLETLHPIWEERYSKNNPPPTGQKQRTLLRPVYWLGNWQFACLNYYHPPKGTENRCIHAEPYPAPLAAVVQRAEQIVRSEFGKEDVPRGWHLNTCLINFYGDRIEGDKRIDCARVGEHKDFELGPVVSLSLGERALFQFVKSDGHQKQSKVIIQQWLEDGDLQIFGGYRFKKQLFHRVQRVETKGGHSFKLPVEGFETRRINFTFRYVPDEHILPWSRLPDTAKEDTRPYMLRLAEKSKFFQEALEPKPR
ncbi:MAG: alpha-ketoglutarate-dependent dioxygenase AlkB [Bdellovibrionaceae bacterium]|nr:alpha-ketoglutarate-dependent dioxygenase AlkB [Pseudobdellovibrionaceae bacterium]